ncbi:unnamed protein product [Effrenium voratum]|nr:unnamed protein product [Effrenium voratum]
MRLLMQEKPGEKSERWLARALLHLALMNLGYNPWAAPEDNLQVVMFHFGLTVDALKELLVSICVPQQGAFQSALQCKWVSPYFRSSGSKPIKGWAASSDSESSSERQRAARVPSGDIRYPLLESPSFQWILREEVDQHMSPAVLRVLAVAKGINLCQADPERARRAARQLPEEVFADMERNAYRVAGSQLPCLSATYRQEVRVVDMLQSNAKRCPCKQVASCADRLYEHCRQNSLDSRTQTAQWMARCLLHCQKGWPREVTYDPDTARIIADEFLAHKFEVCDRTVKVLVDLTALGYDEGPMLLLDAADRQQDVAKASGALLEVAAQMSRLSLAKFALKLGAKVSVRCLCCAASAGHEELFDLTWSAVEKPYAVCMNLLLEGCRSGSVEIVRKILAACGRSDSVNCEFEEEKGLTSLYVAASWGYPDLVDFLLMQQANPQLVDVRGNTALRVAIALQKRVASKDSLWIEDPSWTLLLGDLVDHYGGRDISKKDDVGRDRSLAIFTATLQRAALSSEGRCAVAIGNTDILPAFQVDVTALEYYLPEAKAIQTHCKIPEAAFETLKRYGYYSIELADKTSLLLLNTVIYSSREQPPITEPWLTSRRNGSRLEDLSWRLPARCNFLGSD